MLDRYSEPSPDPNWYGFVTVIDPDHVEEAKNISEELLALAEKQAQQISLRGISKIRNILKSRAIMRERIRLGNELSNIAQRELVGNTEQAYEDMSTGLLELSDHQTELYFMASSIVNGGTIVLREPSSL